MIRTIINWKDVADSWLHKHDEHLAVLPSYGANLGLGDKRTNLRVEHANRLSTLIGSPLHHKRIMGPRRKRNDVTVVRLSKFRLRTPVLEGTPICVLFHTGKLPWTHSWTCWCPFSLVYTYWQLQLIASVMLMMSSMGIFTLRTALLTWSTRSLRVLTSRVLDSYCVQTFYCSQSHNHHHRFKSDLRLGNERVVIDK